MNKKFFRLICKNSPINFIVYQIESDDLTIAKGVAIERYFKHTGLSPEKVEEIKENN